MLIIANIYSCLIYDSDEWFSLFSLILTANPGDGSFFYRWGWGFERHLLLYHIVRAETISGHFIPLEILTTIFSQTLYHILLTARRYNRLFVFYLLDKQVKLMVLACQERSELQGQSCLGIRCWQVKLIASCGEVKDFGVRRCGFSLQLPCLLVAYL